MLSYLTNHKIKYNTFDKIINEIPIFEFRYNNGLNIYKTILHKLNPDDEISDFVKTEINEYINYTLDELFKLLEIELTDNKHFSFLKNGKVKYMPQIIDDNMMQCNNCGNIWDGCAQCDCYQYYDIV